MQILTLNEKENWTGWKPPQEVYAHNTKADIPALVTVTKEMALNGRFGYAPLPIKAEFPDKGATRSICFNGGDGFVYVINGIGLVRMNENGISISPPQPNVTINEILELEGITEMGTTRVSESGEIIEIPNTTPAGGMKHEGAKYKMTQTKAFSRLIKKVPNVIGPEVIELGSTGYDTSYFIYRRPTNLLYPHMFLHEAYNTNSPDFDSIHSIYLQLIASKYNTIKTMHNKGYLHWQLHNSNWMIDPEKGLVYIGDLESMEKFTNMHNRKYAKRMNLKWSIEMDLKTLTQIRTSQTVPRELQNIVLGKSLIQILSSALASYHFQPGSANHKNVYNQLVRLSNQFLKENSFYFKTPIEALGSFVTNFEELDIIETILPRQQKQKRRKR
jgi:hypothetical protein